MGLHPPSLDDIQLLITQKWADYSICISSKEIWIIEYKGGHYKTAYDEITKKVSKWENEAIELLKMENMIKQIKFMERNYKTILIIMNTILTCIRWNYEL